MCILCHFGISGGSFTNEFWDFKVWSALIFALCVSLGFGVVFFLGFCVDSGKKLFSGLFSKYFYK